MKCNIKLRIYQQGDSTSPYIDIRLGKDKIQSDYLSISESILNGGIEFIVDDDSKIDPDLLENGKITRDSIQQLLRKSFAKPIDIDEMFKSGSVVHTHTLQDLITQYGSLPLNKAEDIKVLVTSKFSSQFNNKILRQGDEDIYVIYNSQSSVINLTQLINDRRNVKLECENDPNSDLYKQGLEHLTVFSKISEKIIKDLKKSDKDFAEELKDGKVSYEDFYNYISELKENLDNNKDLKLNLESQVKDFQNQLEQTEDKVEKDKITKDIRSLKEQISNLKVNQTKELISELTYYLELFDIDSPAKLYDAFLTKNGLFEKGPYSILKDSIQKSLDIYNGVQSQLAYNDLFTENVLSKFKYQKERSNYSKSEYNLSLVELSTYLTNLVEMLNIQLQSEKDDLNKSRLNDEINNYANLVIAIKTIQNKDASKDEVFGAKKTLFQGFKKLLESPSTEIDFKFSEFLDNTDDEVNLSKSINKSIYKTKDGYFMRVFTSSGTLEERYHIKTDTENIPKQIGDTKGGYNIYTINFNGTDFYFTCKGQWTPATVVKIYQNKDFAERDRNYKVYKQNTSQHDLEFNMSDSGFVLIESNNYYKPGTIVTAYSYKPNSKNIDAVSDPSNIFHTFVYGEVTISQALSFFKKGQLLKDLTAENVKEFNQWFRSKNFDIEKLKLFAIELANKSFPMSISDFKKIYENFEKIAFNSRSKYIITDCESIPKSTKKRVIANQISDKKTKVTESSENLYGAFKKFASLMKDKLGIDVELVDKIKGPIKAGAKAWIKDGTIYINVHDASLQDGFHEYCHLLLGYFKLQLDADSKNKKRKYNFTYEDFLEDFASTKNTDKLIEAKQSLYPNRSRYDLLEEVFCDEFGKAIIKSYGEIKSIDGFFSEVFSKFMVDKADEVVGNAINIFTDGFSKIMDDNSKLYASQFVRSFGKFINTKFGSKIADDKLLKNTKQKNALKKERQIRNFIEDNLTTTDSDFNKNKTSIKEECE